MKAAILLFCLLVASFVGAQQGPKVGETAPKLQLLKALGEGAGPQVGVGRWTVVDFWATWCGPCVAEFPHANQLIADMKGQPVDFVGVTDEKEEKVKSLLAGRPFNARIALDNEGKTFKAYGVAVVPTTFVVDPQGKVVAITTLKNLDKAVMTKILQGKPFDLPKLEMEAADLDWDEKGGFSAATSVSHLIVQRSNARSGGTKMPPGGGRISGDGVGFANMIHLAYDAEFYEVINTHPEYENFEKRYRISVKAADDKPETARQMLLAELKRMFVFNAEWVEVEEDVPVLRRLAGVDSPDFKPSRAEKSSGMARSGVIQLEKVAMKGIADMIGGFGYGKGVVDETGLKGDFDFKLEWTPRDKSSFEAALKKVGLECKVERRKVRRLRLSPG